MPANRDVFVNCPFDDGHKALFHATVFTILRSGFRVRCALESDDGGVNRFAKICSIIKECRYGIHDISRTDVGGDPPLPRFNMPLELGVFLGAKYYGKGDQKQKRCIVFDVERYRFQRFISDLAGQDIHAHKANERILIEELAAWLREQDRDPKVPGGRAIAGEYELFKAELPLICRALALDIEELTFGDFSGIVAQYLLTR